jgi:hypothetical protein
VNCRKDGSSLNWSANNGAMRQLGGQLRRTGHKDIGMQQFPLFPGIANVNLRKPIVPDYSEQRRVFQLQRVALFL